MKSKDAPDSRELSVAPSLISFERTVVPFRGFAHFTYEVYLKFLEIRKEYETQLIRS